MLIKMNFEFTDREGTGLQVINNMWRNTKFADLKMEDFDRYLATYREFNPDGMEAYPNRRMSSQTMINFENTRKNVSVTLYQIDDTTRAKTHCCPD